MRVMFTQAAGCLIVVATVLPVAADEPKPEAFTAQDVLDRMAKAYAGCNTYRDTGVVKTVFIRTTGTRTVEKPFKTAFIRPNRFRFEYTEKRGGREDRYIVWRNGKEVQTWWDVDPGVQKPESLKLALAGATGVSSGSAHTVPALLLPKEVGGRRLTELTAAKRAKDAKLDKVDCFRIEGMFLNAATTVWIDKNTYLVRRIDAKKSFDNFRTEATTTYDPVINAETPDKALEFDPPKGGEAKTGARSRSGMTAKSELSTFRGGELQRYSWAEGVMFVANRPRRGAANRYP